MQSIPQPPYDLAEWTRRGLCLWSRVIHRSEQKGVRPSPLVASKAMFMASDVAKSRRKEELTRSASKPPMTLAACQETVR